MRDWAGSCASIRACRYRLLPESSSGCSRCTSGIGNAPWPKGIHDVPNGESILRANLCARQATYRTLIGRPRIASPRFALRNPRPNMLSVTRTEGAGRRKVGMMMSRLSNLTSTTSSLSGPFADRGFHSASRVGLLPLHRG